MNCDLKTFHVPIAFFDYTIKKYFTNNIYYMYNIIQLNDKKSKKNCKIFL